MIKTGTVFSKTESIMSSGHKSSKTVFGYVRTNYHRDILKAIIKLCKLYFDADTLIKLKRNKLKQFLSKRNEGFYTYKCKIKFNQELPMDYPRIQRGYHVLEYVPTNYRHQSIIS